MMYIFKFQFQVSWIRYADTSLLTVGRYTYTTDLRFEAFHSPHTDDWIVRLKNPRPSDSGFYGCQISTTPHRTQLIYLTVHGRFFPYLFFYATIKLRKVQFLVHLPTPKISLWEFHSPHADDCIVRLKKPMTFRHWFLWVSNFYQPTLHSTDCAWLVFSLFFYAMVKLLKVQFLVHLPSPKNIFMGISLPTRR